MKDALEVSPGDDGGSAAYYRQKYKTLKRKLRLLVYEQECFIDELKTTQRKLLKVSRDKSFLLDRLLQLETLEESSSDSEATASSDSDNDRRRKQKVKRRKRPITFAELPNMNEATAALLAKMSGDASGEKPETQKSDQKSDSGPTPKKRSKNTTKRDRSRSKKSSHSGRPSSSDQVVYTGMLSREEVERQLDAKQPVMGIEKAQATLPMDIFNDDNSLQHVELTEK